MKAPGIPANEQQRIEALYKYNILDTLPEKDFDDITKLASEICNTPIAHISLVDSNRVWLKSAIGIEVGDVARNESFCAHTIVDPNDIMIVSDSSKDERFSDNPYVTGDPNIAFYAGVPLITDDGQSLGSLCVIDRTPRSITDGQKQALKALSNQIVRLLDLRFKGEQLEKTNKQLERFSYIVAHDLKSPLNGIYSIITLLKEDERITTQPDLNEYFDLITNAGEHLSGMIGSLLEHAKP